MPETPTPREIFLTLQRRIQDGARGEIADMYAEDAVVRHVFGAAGKTSWNGREELRAHFDRQDVSAVKLQAHNTVVHETADPEVIVVEWDYDITFAATGQTVRMPNIVVVRIRDGLIVSSRDYHNHFGLAVATGRAEALLAQVTAANPD
jgi:uncharacterized protein